MVKCAQHLTGGMAHGALIQAQIGFKFYAPLPPSKATVCTHFLKNELKRNLTHLSGDSLA